MNEETSNNLEAQIKANGLKEDDNEESTISKASDYL